MAEAAAADFLTATCPPPPKHAHPRSHPRPPTPIHAHGRAPARPGPRRLKQPRGGWQAFFASPALRPLPGERPTRCRSLASTSAAAALPLDGILSSPPAPPARLRSTATGRQPSPRLALAGLHLPGARPARVPPSLLAGQRTPTFLARVRPGKRAPLGRERKPCVPVQPTHRRPAGAPDLGATAPVTGGRRCPGPEPSPTWRGPCLSRQSPSREPLCQRAPPHHHHPVRAGPRERCRPERRSQAHTLLGPWA